MIAARDGRDWFKPWLELVCGVLPVFEESCSTAHHLHMSSALPQIVAEIRRFWCSRTRRLRPTEGRNVSCGLSRRIGTPV